MEKVAKGHYDFNSEEWEGVSKEAKQLIKRMLEFESSKRANALECLNDPWVRQYNNKQGDVDAPIIKKVLENMRNFRVQQKLQEATFHYIVNYLSTKEEK